MRVAGPRTYVVLAHFCFFCLRLSFNSINKLDIIHNGKIIQSHEGSLICAHLCCANGRQLSVLSRSPQWRVRAMWLVGLSVSAPFCRTFRQTSTCPMYECHISVDCFMVMVRRYLFRVLAHGLATANHNALGTQICIQRSAATKAILLVLFA